MTRESNGLGIGVPADDSTGRSGPDYDFHDWEPNWVEESATCPYCDSTNVEFDYIGDEYEPFTRITCQECKKEASFHG